MHRDFLENAILGQPYELKLLNGDIVVGVPDVGGSLRQNPSATDTFKLRHNDNIISIIYGDVVKFTLIPKQKRGAK